MAPVSRMMNLFLLFALFMGNLLYGIHLRMTGYYYSKTIRITIANRYSTVCRYVEYDNWLLLRLFLNSMSLLFNQFEYHY